MSFYDSRWLVDVFTLPDELLLTLNIPPASQPTVFTPFEAKLLSKLIPDEPQMAPTWQKEAPYLTLSEDKPESSVFFSEEHFEHCLVYLCTEFEPKRSQRSMDTLFYCDVFFSSPIDALAVCETTAVTLPKN